MFRLPTDDPRLLCYVDGVKEWDGEMTSDEWAMRIYGPLMRRAVEIRPDADLQFYRMPHSNLLLQSIGDYHIVAIDARVAKNHD